MYCIISVMETFKMYVASFFSSPFREALLLPLCDWMLLQGDFRVLSAPLMEAIYCLTWPLKLSRWGSLPGCVGPGLLQKSAPIQRTVIGRSSCVPVCSNTSFHEHSSKWQLHLTQFQRCNVNNEIETGMVYATNRKVAGSIPDEVIFKFT
jgi:hypothetical protein